MRAPYRETASVLTPERRERIESVLGLVPARGGSKGIPRKNLRALAGRPLLAYVAEAAAASGAIDRLIVSTDSEEVAELARSVGIEVPFMRPAALARDDTPMYPVVRHALEELDRQGRRADAVAILQPTSPLRRPAHLAGARRLLEEERCSSVVSVTEIPPHFSPDYAMKIVDGRLVNFLSRGAAVSRRQDVGRAYSRDGTIYMIRRETVLEENSLYGDDARPLVIPAHESVNLDDRDDWERAERLLSEG